MRIKNILLLFTFFLVFVQCNDNDEYYDEPSWLEKPLFEVLQEKGRFSMYLQCVERTPYAPVIKEGGLYTLFAPNDEAFAKFLVDEGYASVEDIPQDVVNAIVGNSMVFSRWTYTHLGDVYNGTNELPYLTGLAIKKRTSYYSTVYQDPDFNNEWVVDQNRIAGTYDREYFSYKYLPVITAQYFRRSGLYSMDYNLFFPETPFSLENPYNANVYDAQVINAGEGSDADGMIARNGVAHEINKVVLPLPNMDKFLYEPQYAYFKSLLDFKTMTGAYAYKSYQEDATLTEFFKKLYPEIGNKTVYVKSYDAAYSNSATTQVFFSPIYEQYAIDGTASPTYTETDGFTLFVPTETALKEYMDEKIYKYYPKLEEAPIEAITALINVHMGERMIWPSAFSTAQASTGEYINGLGRNGGGYDEMNVVSQEMASNGFIYLIDRVIKSKWFETVYTRVFLDPAYSILNRAYINYYSANLRMELMESIITDGIGSKKFTLLLPSDEILSADGYYKAINDAGVEVLLNPLLLSGTVDERMRRLLRMHILQGYSANGVDTEIESFQGDGPGEYGGWGFRTTYFGDMIRFKDNKVQAVGNIEDGTFAEVELLEEFDNGSVYKIKGDMLQYSPRKSHPASEDGWKSRSLWKYLSDMRDQVATTTDFVNYVEAALKSADSDDLLGLSDESFYTVLVVNNSSMNAARSRNLIPRLDSLSQGTEENIARNKEKVARFLYSHFLSGRIYPDDGLENYLYPYNSNQPNEDLAATSLRITNEQLGLINSRAFVKVSKNGDVLRFEPQPIYDQTGQNVLVNVSRSLNVVVRRGAIAAYPDTYRSNRMAGRAVLHEIQGFFAFEEVEIP